MSNDEWRDWESQDDHNLLVKCVGFQYGDKPEENLPAIREARGGYGYTVANRMGLTREDVVLDIGSGCGFVGRTIAPIVKTLHCTDLSRSFLTFCEKELSEFGNVECHLIGYADFSALHGKGINRVYSTALWIHFNFYDIYYYLAALGALLPKGGTIYFDYADPEGIPGPDHGTFKAHSQGYKSDRTTIQTQLNYNSLEAVKRALSLTGFTLDEFWRTHEDAYSVLVRKL